MQFSSVAEASPFQLTLLTGLCLIIIEFVIDFLFSSLHDKKKLIPIIHLSLPSRLVPSSFFRHHQIFVFSSASHFVSFSTFFKFIIHLPFLVTKSAGNHVSRSFQAPAAVRARIGRWARNDKLTANEHGCSQDTGNLQWLC